MREKTRDALQEALFEAFFVVLAMPRDYANLGAIIGTFSYREKELVDRYDEVLAALDGSKPGV